MFACVLNSATSREDGWSSENIDVTSHMFYQIEIGTQHICTSTVFFPLLKQL